MTFVFFSCFMRAPSFQNFFHHGVEGTFCQALAPEEAGRYNEGGAGGAERLRGGNRPFELDAVHTAGRKHAK